MTSSTDASTTSKLGVFRKSSVCMCFLYSFLSICARRPHTAGPFLRFKIYNRRSDRYVTTFVVLSLSFFYELLCNGYRKDRRFWRTARPTRRSLASNVPCRCHRTTGCTTSHLRSRQNVFYFLNNNIGGNNNNIRNRNDLTDGRLAVRDQ